MRILSSSGHYSNNPPRCYGIWEYTGCVGFSVMIYHTAYKENMEETVGPGIPAIRLESGRLDKYV